MSNNRFLSRFAPVAAAAVLAAAAALASSGAASGSEDEEPLTPTTSAIGGETAEDAATRAELRELATRQTVEEIQRIVGSGKPVVALYDIETNTYLAAKLVDPFSKAAITPRGRLQSPHAAQDALQQTSARPAQTTTATTEPEP